MVSKIDQLYNINDLDLRDFLRLKDVLVALCTFTTSFRNVISVWAAVDLYDMMITPDFRFALAGKQNTITYTKQRRSLHSVQRDQRLNLPFV